MAAGWIDGRYRLAVDGFACRCGRHRRLGLLADVPALLTVLISVAKQSKTDTGGEFHEIEEGAISEVDRSLKAVAGVSHEMDVGGRVYGANGHAGSCPG